MQQNAEAANEDFSAEMGNFPACRWKCFQHTWMTRLGAAYFETRENDTYICTRDICIAKFRLWMELRLYACQQEPEPIEIVGEKAFEPRTGSSGGWDGVCCGSGNERKWPKTLPSKAEDVMRKHERECVYKHHADWKAPCHWNTNPDQPASPADHGPVKTALALKMHERYDLAAHEEGAEMTNAGAFFSDTVLMDYSPAIQDSLIPALYLKAHRRPQKWISMCCTTILQKHTAAAHCTLKKCRRLWYRQWQQ